MRAAASSSCLTSESPPRRIREVHTQIHFLGVQPQCSLGSCPPSYHKVGWTVSVLPLHGLVAAQMEGLHSYGEGPVVEPSRASSC